MKMKKFNWPVTAEVLVRLAEAKKAGLLYKGNIGRGNIPCDHCGKDSRDLVVLAILKSKTQEDPMEGEVYTFGLSCYTDSILPRLELLTQETETVKALKEGAYLAKCYLAKVAKTETPFGIQTIQNSIHMIENALQKELSR